MPRRKKNSEVVEEVKVVAVESESVDEVKDEPVVEVETSDEKPKKKEVIKFDRKAFAHNLVELFKDNEAVDVVPDTELEEGLRAPGKIDYEYIHFFKKGTTKNMFQLYVKNGDCKFVVGTSLLDFIGTGEKFGVTPVEKKKGDEKKVVYVRINCAHEDAEEVAKVIIAANYLKHQVVEVPVEETTTEE